MVVLCVGMLSTTTVVTGCEVEEEGAIQAEELEDESSDESAGGDDSRTEDDTEGSEDGEEAASPPRPRAPKPVVISDSGARVKTIRLRANTPLVITAEHRGSSNFIVELVGQGANELLFNEIGSYQGQTALGEASRGRYRVRIDADGSWQLRFDQPAPKANATRVPGVLSGRGAKVVPILSNEDLQPIVVARHRQGTANFIVDLIGYGGLTGEILLFNEIGPFRGETLVDDMPAGNYLLEIQADGAWTVRFRR